MGLQGLTIGRLAGDVGISKAGIYAHFDSKDHLLRSVLDHAVDAFLDDGVRPALREPPGEPRLRALFDAWLEWTAAADVPGGCLFISSSAELDDRPGALRERLVEVQRDWLNLLEESAAEGRDRGHFRDDLDPGQLVFELQSIVLGFHHVRRLLRGDGAEARARYAFEALVRRARPPASPPAS